MKWLAVLALAVAAAWLIRMHAPSRQLPQPGSIVAPAGTDAFVAPDGQAAAAAPSELPEPGELALAERAERERWLLAHGYFSTDYASYADETLRQMADLGDVLALEELADRLKLTNPAEAMELNWHAAVLGSTSAIQRNVTIYRHLASGQSTDDDGSPRIELVNAYAWGLVSQMRGDPNGGSSNLDVQLRDALHAFEVDAACALAGHLYTQLAEARRAAGLRAFDNAPTPVASIDLGRAGEMCVHWPVRRASCARDRRLPPAVSLHAYRCGAAS